MDDLLQIILAHPQGVSPQAIERELKVSRATLNRRLKELLGNKQIEARGEGVARVYAGADPVLSIKQYFDLPHTARTFAPYREALLDPEPAFKLDTLRLPGKMVSLEKKDLVRFLVDFSCASSVLEGGAYSLLDTQVLLDYGEKAGDKPLADAFLVLNHKSAFEYLFSHAELTQENMFEVHRRLVSTHGVTELADAPHFLPDERCGRLREYEDVNISLSTYSPPFRPGTGYIGKMLARIIETANSIESPVASAFYLLTRLPYLQPFADGNKRTSRVMCNVPLLRAGMPPISFMDFGKRDYVISMLAFYELGDIRMAEKCFADAYIKSAERLGLIDSPNHRRMRG